MSDTPRTDPHRNNDFYLGGTVPEWLAEQLERENNALRAALALAIKEADGWLDEARGCTPSELADGDPLKGARELL